MSLLGFSTVSIYNTTDNYVYLIHYIFGQKWYNNLPDNIKSCGNVNKFKRLLKELLVDKCVYETFDSVF